MCTIAHVWAPLTSAGTCGGKGEGAENARLAWAEIASGSLHSTFTVFWAKRATTWDFQQFFFYSYIDDESERREKESQHRCATINPADTGLPGCRAPRTVAWSVCRAAARGQLEARRTAHQLSPRRLAETHTLWGTPLTSARGTSRPRGDQDTRDALGALLLTT